MEVVQTNIICPPPLRRRILYKGKNINIPNRRARVDQTPVGVVAVADDEERSWLPRRPPACVDGTVDGAIDGRDYWADETHGLATGRPAYRECVMCPCVFGELQDE